MDGLVQVVGRLLSELHAAFPAKVCPGDWAWTTTLIGALLALLPMGGAVLVALIRKWTGNRYNVGPLLGVAAVGLVMTAALPWLGFHASSEVFRGALRGEAAAVGLRRSDLASMTADFCFAPPQVEYLGGAHTVRQVLGTLPDDRPAVFAGGVLLLVVLPLLAMVFVFAQSRLAFRRGPAWPARLLWLPMPLLMIGTASLSATVVAHLWLGYLPATMLGMLGVMLVGPPRRSVIDGTTGATTLPPATVAPDAPHGGASGPRPVPGPAGGTPGQAPYGLPAGGFGLARRYGSSRPMPAMNGPRWPPVPPTVTGQPLPGGPGARGGPGGQPPRRTSAAPFGPPDTSGAADPSQQPARVLSTDPGPLPQTLQRALGLAAPGDTSQPPEPPTLPASRFRRIRPLGSGGFGTVWLAMDTALDRTVAVKAAKAPDAETEQRIRREARALAAVHHPNCVRVYDLLTDADGELALIMEYVPGRSLSTVVDADGPLPDPVAAQLWSTLAGALHAAHLQGVLHRDVKPSNIIIDEDGRPHLIDFGIARATGDVTLTAAGMVLGTPDYMAPEVAAGKPASPAADAWQLAATVSFALAARPPRGHRDGAIAAMLAAAQGEPCNQVPVRSAHRELLQRALHPDPALRPDLPTVQAELAPWLAAADQWSDGPVTELLLPPTPPPPSSADQTSPLPSPAWPTEDQP